MEQEVEKWEMFDANAELGGEQVNGVFGDELFEGYEEGGLKRGGGADVAPAEKRGGEVSSYNDYDDEAGNRSFANLIRDEDIRIEGISGECE